MTKGKGRKVLSLSGIGTTKREAPDVPAKVVVSLRFVIDVSEGVASVYDHVPFS